VASRPLEARYSKSSGKEIPAIFANWLTILGRLAGQLAQRLKLDQSDRYESFSCMVSQAWTSSLALGGRSQKILESSAVD